MGYTNYWKVKEDNEGFTEEVLDNVKQIIDKSRVVVGNGMGEHDTLPELTDKIILLNGMDEHAHESFFVAAKRPGFGFTKTARKPYDVIVKAVCMYLQYIGYIYDFSWDGDMEDTEYSDAVELLKECNLESVVDEFKMCEE